MAEADIDSMKAMTDGLPYGPQERGAWTTIQTRVKPDQAATTSAIGLVELATDAEHVTGTDSTRAATPAGIKAKLNAASALSTSSHTVSGAYNVNWAVGRFFRVNATANITSITESAGPGTGLILEGALEVINTSGGSITVDTTGMAYGLDGVLTITVGTREMIFLTSTGA